MNLQIVHFEHALPAFSELGLEHLAPVFMGGQVLLDEAAIGNILEGLAGGAQKHASRRLVAVLRASGPDLLEWEADPSKEAVAVKAAALLPFVEAKDIITDFFGSLGLSPSITLGSSEVTESPAEPAVTTTGVPG